MAWSTAGVQTDTDTSLVGFDGVTGVTSSVLGGKTIYNVASGTTISITGTLTINPEIERIVTNSGDNVIAVASGGQLNLGTEITVTLTDGTTNSRYSKGVAIFSTLPENPWHGNGSDNTLVIVSGGKLHWRGATLGGHALVDFASGSSVWIEEGVIDNLRPLSGVAGRPDSGRGNIAWWATSDIRIDGFTLRQSGEIIFGAQPSGTNGIDSSLSNGIFGYGSAQAVHPMFPNRINNFRLENSALANSGNTKDITVQSEGTNIITHTSVYNELGGTSLRCIAGENGADARNFGVISIYRQINFDAKNGITGANVTDGRWFIRDKNNGLRKNANGVVSNVDFTYTGTFSAGTSTQTDVLLGIVNADKTEGILGLNTTNDPANAATINAEYRTDKRTESDVLGTDTFDVHSWVYEYDYLPMSNVDFTDGTTGVKDLRVRYTTDTGVTKSRTLAGDADSAIDTALAFTGTAITITDPINLDDLYDVIKIRKEATEASIQVPSSSTLLISSDGNEIDFGTLTVSVTGTGKLSVSTEDTITHTAVKHNTILSLDAFALSGLTLTAPVLTVAGTSLTIPAGCKPIGTITKSSAFAITVEDGADVSELKIAGTGAYTITGARESDFSSSSTASDVTEAFTHTVEVDTSAVGVCQFRVLQGSTLALITGTGSSVTSGIISAVTDSHTITLDSTVIPSLVRDVPLVVCVTAADGNDLRHVTTVQDITDGIAINANTAYNTNASADTGIAGSIDTPIITAYTITMNAGLNLLGADTNKTFNSLRSTQNYCDFIAFLGLDGSILNTSQTGTVLDAGTIKLTAVEVGSEATNPAVQGLSLDTAAALSTIFTAGSFTTSDPINIGLTITADSAVDYAAVGSTVKSVVQEPLKKVSLSIPVFNSDFD